MNLSATEIKKLLKGWHFYRSSISSEEDGALLKRKLDAIEKSLVILDDVSKMIIKTYYFDKTEMSVVVQRAFMVRSAVYKRIEKAVDEMEYYIANTA